MAGAYHTLEESGLYTKADCIASIIDRSGEEVYHSPEPVRVYERDAADAMTDVMKGVLAKGTAASSGWAAHTDIEAAGKTGTTNDNKAAWFCGYTPYYTIAVWVGCDTPETVESLQGATYPLRIWEETMLSLIHGKPSAKLKGLPKGMKEEKSRCTCKRKCTAHTKDESCPVCRHIMDDESAELFCKGAVPECICTDKCHGDELNENCPACMQDASLCKGVDANTPCTCKQPCSKGKYDKDCPRCSKNWSLCGQKEEPECICDRNCEQNGINKKCPACMKNPELCNGKKDPEQKAEFINMDDGNDKPENADDGSEKTDDADIPKPADQENPDYMDDEKPDDAKDQDD